MNSTVPYYNEAFPKDMIVRVADSAFLHHFMLTWKYHHNLRPEQLAYAGWKARVIDVGFYHGGDPLYELEGIPGFWHEECLRRA